MRGSGIQLGQENKLRKEERDMWGWGGRGGVAVKCTVVGIGLRAHARVRCFTAGQLPCAGALPQTSSLLY